MNKLLLGTAFSLVLGGCSQHSDMPLVFGQSQKVGIGIEASQTGSADFTLGYLDANIAVIPVTQDGGMISGTQCAFSPTADSNGEYQEICDEDTLSVIGQFEVDATANSVGLGKFFGTGHAANSLAEGFKARLEDASDVEDE